MPRWHTRSRPHRKLYRTARGEDVKRFQAGLNARLEHHPRSEGPTAVDGVFGNDTLRAWRQVRYIIGLPVGHPPTVGSQLNVRQPWTRSPSAVRRAKARRRRLDGGGKPRIITAGQLGLRFAWVFGAKGEPYRSAGHYTAGPRAANAAELADEARRDHGYHAGKGWGGLAYDYMIADDGTLLLGNPIGRKSAHVGGANTGNVGICCPGTLGDRPTQAQAATLKWLLANAHTRALPSAHRSPVDLRRLPLLGHHEYPGNATSCPGQFLSMYHAKGSHR